jgi:hypothetical protein
LVERLVEWKAVKLVDEMVVLKVAMWVVYWGVERADLLVAQMELVLAPMLVEWLVEVKAASMVYWRAETMVGLWVFELVEL